MADSIDGGDPSVYGDPGGDISGLDLSGQGDLPPADPGSDLTGGSQPGADTSGDVTNTENAPDQGTITVWNFDDGSQYYPDTGVFVDAQGNNQEITGMSSDGTVLQFADGTVLDQNTGTSYQDMNAFLNDDGSQGTSSANGGKGAGSGSSAGSGSTPGAPKGGGGGGSPQQPPKPTTPDPTTTMLANALSKMGAAITSLLSGQGIKAAVPVNAQLNKAALPVAPGSVLTSGGTMLMLVIFGGLFLLVAVRHSK